MLASEGATVVESASGPRATHVVTDEWPVRRLFGWFFPSRASCFGMDPRAGSGLARVAGGKGRARRVVELGHGLHRAEAHRPVRARAVWAGASVVGRRVR